MRVNYFFKLMVAAVLMLAATTVKAADVPVTTQGELQAAIDNAQAGDVILVTQSIELTGTLWLKKVTIKGQGNGIEIKAASTFTERASQVLLDEGPETKAHYENLTFTGAYNNGGETDGGFFRVLNGNGTELEFVKCKFTDNFAAGRGGAFCIQDNAKVTFTDCEISNNKSNRAGAIWIAGDQTEVTFQNCVIENNQATGNLGGAFYLENAPTLIIRNSVLKGNMSGTYVDGTASGQGGAVFTTAGASTIEVYSSAIVENNCYGDHGGVLFAMGQPKVSFINTTIANNRMWKDSNSMFWTPEGGEFNFINATVAGNWGAPNAGNSTAFTMQNVNCKAKIYNSIFVGNVSREGNEIGGTGPAVDVKLSAGIVAKLVSGTATDVLDVRNSIIGFISVDGSENTLTTEQIGYITANENAALPHSIINEYTRTKDWKLADKSGINWEAGLKTLTGGQAYYPVSGVSKAVNLGDPALLSAHINPLVDQIGTPRTGEKITSGAIEYANPLPLDNMNLKWGDYDYNQDTHVLSLAGEWSGGIGWEWVPVLDLSDYSKVVIEFAQPLPTGVALHAQYTADGDGINGVPEDAFVNGGSQSVTLALDPTLKDRTRKIYFQVQNGEKIARTIEIKNAYLLENGYILPYKIDKLNLFDGASYDEATHAITYNNGWAYAGWTWEADGGMDFSGYDQVWIKYDASGVTTPSDDGGASKVEYEVAYMDGSTKEMKPMRSTDTEVSVNLAPGKKVKYIFLKSEKTGTITLTDAYAFKSPILPVDLTITEFTWTPENPLPGDKVTFKAKIKNLSENASPNEKHGVAFYINGAQAPVAWSDTHLTSLAPGEEVELTANGGNSSDGTWTIGKDYSYKVKAEVNDTHNILETSFDNNTTESVLFNGGKPDLVITGLNWRITGNQVVFNVIVKNQGTVHTPPEVKHGVAFSVNGAVVSWSDDRYASIPAGDPDGVRLTANGGPNGVAYWVMTGEGFAVTAEVNDQGEISESDYTNNTFTATYGNVAIGDVSTIKGSIYAENGQLHIVGYPSSASVNLYNVLGQKVASFKSISENMKLNLTGGAYVVQIQNNGKSITQKVLVK